MHFEQPDDGYRKDLLLALVLIATGLITAGLALVQIQGRDHRMAQATQPLQSTPAPQSSAPAPSEPGGARPTTPAPEPARPDMEAQKTGTPPVLLPAPAEKTGEPIKEK